MRLRISHLRSFTLFCLVWLVFLCVPLSTVFGALYWGDLTNQTIQSANLDGSGIEILIDVGLDTPRGIALDLVNGKLYWTDKGGNNVPVGIRRANLDGTFVEDIVTTGLSRPFGIVVDPTGGKLYWTDSATRRIQRANLDGSGVEDVVTPATADIMAPWGIDLDFVHNKIYWVDGSIEKLQRANLDGTDVEEILTGLTNPLRDIVLDVSRNTMFFASADSILAADLDGTGLEVIISLDAGRPIGLAVDPFSEKIYWTTPQLVGVTAKIQRANFDGSGIETLHTLSGGGFTDIDLVASDLNAIPEPGSFAVWALVIAIVLIVGYRIDAKRLVENRR